MADELHPPADTSFDKQRILAAAHRELQRYNEETAAVKRRRFGLHLKPTGFADTVALVCLCLFLAVTAILVYGRFFAHR